MFLNKSLVEYDNCPNSFASYACTIPSFFPTSSMYKTKRLYGAFTLDVKSMLNENLGGILGGTKC